MARLTPAEFGEKWQRNLSASTEDIRRGVNAVTVAPGRLAAAQKATWLARIQQSADKWANNVSRVSLEDWKRKMIDVGLTRVAPGAAANVDKVSDFAADFLPHLYRGVEQVRSMPKTDLESGIQRAVAMMRHNATFRRSGGIRSNTGA